MAKRWLAWMRGGSGARADAEARGDDVAPAPVSPPVPVTPATPVDPADPTSATSAGPWPYRDQGEVARGGMGAIRRVRDTRLDRVVAMKVMDPSLRDRDLAREQFVAEARITGQLDHPNIVPVHELGVDAQGAPYFTMKLVSGRTLAAELRAVGGPPGASARLDEFVGVFAKVCDAVAFAHSRGVVHRDLKPLNILVGSFGQVYVMDWGLARVLRAGTAPPEERVEAEMTSPGVALRRRGTQVPGQPGHGLIGTLPYMAPEQARGHNDAVDERTDVFLLGATLYEIITGVAPHAGASPMEVLFQAGQCDVPPPEVRVPDAVLPRGLGRIAMKAMAREPADRYASALDLKADVERYQRGDGRFPMRSFAPGERVVTEGEEGDAAYVIASGQCEAFRGDGAARVVLRVMGPGDVFGETAIFASKPRTASVEAVGALTVMVVTRDSIAEGLAQQPWLGAFVRALADRFREVDERLRDLQRQR